MRKNNRHYSYNEFPILSRVECKCVHFPMDSFPLISKAGPISRPSSFLSLRFPVSLELVARNSVAYFSKWDSEK